MLVLFSFVLPLEDSMTDKLKLLVIKPKTYDATFGMLCCIYSNQTYTFITTILQRLW